MADRDTREGAWLPETRLETWLRLAWRKRSLRVPWRWTRLISARPIPDQILAYFDELERRCREAGLYGDD